MTHKNLLQNTLYSLANPRMVDGFDAFFAINTPRFLNRLFHSLSYAWLSLNPSFMQLAQSVSEEAVSNDIHPSHALRLQDRFPRLA